jgi:hypothetical protein
VVATGAATNTAQTMTIVESKQSFPTLQRIQIFLPNLIIHARCVIAIAVLSAKNDLLKYFQILMTK